MDRVIGDDRIVGNGFVKDIAVGIGSIIDKIKRDATGQGRFCKVNADEKIGDGEKD